MGQFHWNPGRYLDLMRSDLAAYDELQDEVARACADCEVRDVLDLGTGTGETAKRLMALYPHARLTGVDSSAEMLAQARATLGNAPFLLVARLEDPLPFGPYDLVVSALAVHHLDGAGKRDLFRRVAGVLRPGGRFVLGDVIVPVDPADAVAPLSAAYDLPDSTADQLSWLRGAGLDARVAWELKDLAVLVGEVR